MVYCCEHLVYKSNLIFRVVGCVGTREATLLRMQCEGFCGLEEDVCGVLCFVKLLENKWLTRYMSIDIVLGSCAL